jgi:hypothetical protein
MILFTGGKKLEEGKWVREGKRACRVHMLS